MWTNVARTLYEKRLICGEEVLVGLVCGNLRSARRRQIKEDEVVSRTTTTTGEVCSHVIGDEEDQSTVVDHSRSSVMLYNKERTRPI